jgi:short-subunit dehydrogenase involved in D-alanine esterification of teichoic acids
LFPGFSVLLAHPTLDCVFLNSGTQHPVLLAQAEKVDLAAFHDEINVNFSCMVDLALKFLPRLEAKPGPTSLIITGSGIGLVPAVTLSAYCVSKAALTTFVDCVRREWTGAGKKTRIVEIWPPVVQSEFFSSLSFFFLFFFFSPPYF